MSFLKSNLLNYIYLPHKKHLILSILVAVALSAFLGFMTPRLISNLYESYKLGGDTDGAIKLLVALFLGEYLVSAMYQLSVNRYVQFLLSHIRNNSYRRWILSFENAGAGQYGDQKYPMGEVLSRILTDTEAVIEMVSTGSFRIFIDFAFIISCLIGFIKLNTVSGITLIIAEVLACVVLIVGSKKMAKVYMEVRKSTGIMSRMIANLSGGFRFTYFHPQFHYASKKGYASFEDFLKKQLKANVWDASYFSLAESLFPILLALLVMIFPYSQIVEMAVLAAIIDLIQRSIAPIKEIAGKISSIQRARTGIIRIEEFNTDLDTLPRTSFDSKSQRLELKTLELKVEHFEYDKKDQDNDFSLDDIHIKGKAGQLIGIVGQSGCGKSTILKMLATDIVSDEVKIDYLAQSGEEIHFSGAELEKLFQYKSQVGIVSQDSHVFSSSLRFNIAMSDAESEKFYEFWTMVKEQIAYLKKWDLDPEQDLKPKELSLGQKQLTCALRSCYLAKPIVLFDEISSGLDSELEDALKQLVLLIQKNSLTIIVAHRIETILNADEIIVMSHGKIVGKDSHENLMKNSVPYQEFIAQLNN